MDFKETNFPRLYPFFSIGFGFITLFCVLFLLLKQGWTWPLLFLALPMALAGFFFVLFLRTSAQQRKEVEGLKHQLVRSQIMVKRKSRLADYFDRVLKDAADIIFTLDIDGYILKFNTGAETILGYKQHEIVGTPFTNMLSDPSDATAVFDLVLKHDRVQNFELKMRARDGHIVEVSL